jgi:eukaryotic-like serine/threonine-protein kinase
MESRSRNDDLAMTLVEQALGRPEDEREAYLRTLCGDNTILFAEAWNYVQWEKRMQGFLLDPLHTPSSGSSPFVPGQVLIHRFHLIREVAQGGMGIVWEAIDQKLERRVALKCAKEGFGKQLPPEVRNAREISHPNVCKIFEIHTASTPDGEIDFISMEYLEGETLADRIRRLPLTKAEARVIARQLCAGLAEAHRNGLIHGDLKAKNVILTKDPDGSVRAVITDFGLARRADATTGLVGGTRDYMAPELFKGEKPSVASDIYALGVLLWEVRFGRSPSDLGIESSTLRLGERSTWKPPSGHDKWRRIIAHCVAPDPSARFRNVAEVAKALGPSRSTLWLLGATAALVLAAASGTLTYRQVTAPKETVRLALLPFSAQPDQIALSGRLTRETANELSVLNSSSRTRFRFISLDKVIRNHVSTPEEARVLLGASHALRATLDKRGDPLSLHAYLTELRSGAELREWSAQYKPGEVRYLPAALAGLVTETLHLPPSASGATVKAAASNDYAAGLKALRHDKTLDEALARFERAVKTAPESALPLASLAEAQWMKLAATADQRWLAAAAESVREAQLRNPDLPQVHRVVGLLRSREGHYERAVAEYLRAIELDPRDGDAYRRLGSAYERSGQLGDALVALRKAIEVDPAQYRNYKNLGDFFFDRASYQEAISQYKKALVLAPDEPGLRYQLGKAYENTGQLSLAEKELRASLAASERPAVLHTLGVLLLYERREREAIPTIRKALQLGPETALGWLNLGTAYRRTGQSSEATQAYRSGLKLAESEVTSNPRNALIRSYLAYLCAQMGEAGRAGSEIAQALKEPPNADVVFMAVMTYEALNRREDTLSVLSAAPVGVLKDVSRWPDLADLSRDNRFRQLLTLNEK